MSDSNEEATLDHTSIAADNMVRPMKADAKPRPLHSSPGTEEGVFLCSPGFLPPREAEAASMMPRAPAGVERQ